ncbi:MAG: alpha/beta hydrolase [Bdellovibrionaceae bacterium]|nr:alpha/beta hydrolase [Pseudobdellovibrionaceae bacterium]NUM58869.1 alpha/beta fold hydrolase [Pseudobdellovibrionaceae bacterium]
MGRVYLSFILSFLVMFQISCQKSDSKSAVGNVIDETLVLKVTKENFISGKKFCSLYVNSTEYNSKEFGVWIEVPRNYQEPKEKIKLYAYTRKPFNPSLPSVIFIDGGPGQNTHHSEDIYESSFNQINFDQRGVGCSTADTWEEYIQVDQYSSNNTVQDIEMIRKYFDIKSWAVYGISYGTVPATIYASKYPAVSKSLVLEGVVGSVDHLSRSSFLVEKWNLVLKRLSEKQLASFESVIFSKDRKKISILNEYLGISAYMDAGFVQLKERIFDKLFPLSGGISDSSFEELNIKIQKFKNRYATPQQPGAVDENILITFYCKELNAFAKDKFEVNYYKGIGFVEEPTDKKTRWKDDCHKLGLTEQKQEPYNEGLYKVRRPVYYLQGSHDAATVATGAMEHWRTVPLDRSYFLLAVKGGHNPGLSKLKTENEKIKLEHQDLYKKVFLDEGLTSSFVTQLNNSVENYETNSWTREVKWQLYTQFPKNSFSIEKQFEGIRANSNSLTLE